MLHTGPFVIHASTISHPEVLTFTFHNDHPCQVCLDDDVATLDQPPVGWLNSLPHLDRAAE